MRIDYRRLLLGECEIRERGHFVYTAGGHGADYLAKQKIVPRTSAFCEVGRGLADLGQNYLIHVVVGIPTLGVAFAPFVASTLMSRQCRQVAACWTEIRPDGSHVLAKEFLPFIQGKEVLLLDDIIDSGSTCLRALEAIRNAGGHPRIILAVWNRGTDTSVIGDVPTDALVTEPFDHWAEEDCPLCRDREPMRVDLGHGAAWCKQHPDYPVAP